MSVVVLTPRDQIVDTGNVFNVTSRSKDFARALSPFLLGPVVADGLESKNVENAWQYSKVYQEHDFIGQPNEEWEHWRREGFGAERAQRYPMGKGRKPVYSWWEGERLDYVRARKRIYIPLYSYAVRTYAETEFQRLQQLHTAHGNIALIDFDAYDHRRLGYSWVQVINDPKRKMGHGFVLAMMLEGVNLQEICQQ